MALNLSNISSDVRKIEFNKFSSDMKSFFRKEYVGYDTKYLKRIKQNADRLSESNIKIIFKKFKVSPLGFLGATVAKDVALSLIKRDYSKSDTSWIDQYSTSESRIPVAFIMLKRGVAWGFKGTDSNELFWVIIKTKGSQKFLENSTISINDLMRKLDDDREEYLLRYNILDLGTVDIASEFNSKGKKIVFDSNSDTSFSVNYSIKGKGNYLFTFNGEKGKPLFIEKKVSKTKIDKGNTKNKKPLSEVTDDLYKVFIKNIKIASFNIADEVKKFRGYKEGNNILKGSLTGIDPFQIIAYLSVVKTPAEVNSILDDNSFMDLLSNEFKKLNDTNELKEKLSAHKVFFAFIYSLQRLHYKRLLDLDDAVGEVYDIKTLKSGVYNQLKGFIEAYIRDMGQVSEDASPVKQGKIAPMEVLSKSIRFTEKDVKKNVLDMSVNKRNRFKRGVFNSLNLSGYLTYLNVKPTIALLNDEKLFKLINSKIANLDDSVVVYGDPAHKILFLYLNAVLNAYKNGAVEQEQITPLIDNLSVDADNFYSKILSILPDYIIGMGTSATGKLIESDLIDLNILKEELSKTVELKRTNKESLGNFIYLKNQITKKYREEYLKKEKELRDDTDDKEWNSYKGQLKMEMGKEVSNLQKKWNFNFMKTIDFIYNLKSGDELGNFLTSKDKVALYVMKEMSNTLTDKKEISNKIGNKFFYTILNKIIELYGVNAISSSGISLILDELPSFNGLYDNQKEIFKKYVFKQIKINKEYVKNTSDEIIREMNEITSNKEDKDFYSQQMEELIRSEKIKKTTGKTSKRATSFLKVAGGKSIDSLDSYQEYVNSMIFPLLKTKNILGVKLLFKLYAKAIRNKLFKEIDDIENVFKKIKDLDGYSNLIIVLVDAFKTLSSSISNVDVKKLFLSQQNYKVVSNRLVDGFISNPNEYIFSNCSAMEYSVISNICNAFNSMIMDVYGIRDIYQKIPSIKTGDDEGASTSSMEIRDNKSPEVQYLEKEKRLISIRDFCRDMDLNKKECFLFTSPGLVIDEPNDIKLIFVELFSMIKKFYENGVTARKSVDGFYNIINDFDKKISYIGDTSILKIIRKNESFDILVNEDDTVLSNIFRLFTDVLYVGKDGYNIKMKISTKSSFMKESELIRDAFDRFKQNQDIIENQENVYLLDSNKILYLKELEKSYPQGKMKIETGAVGGSEIATALSDIVRGIGLNNVLSDGNIVDKLIRPNGTEEKYPYNMDSKFEKALIFFKKRLYNAPETMDVVYLFVNLLKLSSITQTQIDSNRKHIMQVIDSKITDYLMENYIEGDENDVTIEDIQNLSNKETPDKLYDIFIKFIIESMKDLPNNLINSTEKVLKEAFIDVKTYIEETINNDLRALTEKTIKEQVFGLKSNLKSSESNKIKSKLFSLTSKVFKENEDLLVGFVEQYDRGEVDLSSTNIDKLFGIIEEFGSSVTSTVNKKEFDQMIFKLNGKVSEISESIKNIGQNYIFNISDVFTTIAPEIFNKQADGAILNILNYDDNIEYWAEKQLYSDILDNRGNSKQVKDININIESMFDDYDVTHQVKEKLIDIAKKKAGKKKFKEMNIDEGLFREMLDKTYMKAAKIKKRRRPYNVDNVSYSEVDDLFLGVNSSEDLTSTKRSNITGNLTNILSLIGMGKLVYRNAKLVEGSLIGLIDKDGEFNPEHFTFKSPLFRTFYSDWLNGLDEESKGKVLSDNAKKIEFTYKHEEKEIEVEDIDNSSEIDDYFKNGVNVGDLIAKKEIEHIIDSLLESDRVSESDHKDFQVSKDYFQVHPKSFNGSNTGNRFNILSQNLGNKDFKYLLNYLVENYPQKTSLFHSNDIFDILKKASEFKETYIVSGQQVVGGKYNIDGKQFQQIILFKDKAHRNQVLLNIFSLMFLSENFENLFIIKKSEYKLIDFLVEEIKMMKKYNNRPFFTGLQMFIETYKNTTVYSDMFEKVKRLFNEQNELYLEANKDRRKFTEKGRLLIVMTYFRNLFDNKVSEIPIKEGEISIEEREFIIEQIHHNTLSLGGVGDLNTSKEFPVYILDNLNETYPEVEAGKYAKGVFSYMMFTYYMRGAVDLSLINKMLKSNYSSLSKNHSKRSADKLMLEAMIVLEKYLDFMRDMDVYSAVFGNTVLGFKEQYTPGNFASIVSKINPKNYIRRNFIKGIIPVPSLDFSSKNDATVASNIFAKEIFSYVLFSYIKRGSDTQKVEKEVLEILNSIERSYFNDIFKYRVLVLLLSYLKELEHAGIYSDIFKEEVELEEITETTEEFAIVNYGRFFKFWYDLRFEASLRVNTGKVLNAISPLGKIATEMPVPTSSYKKNVTLYGKKYADKVFNYMISTYYINNSIQLDDISNDIKFNFSQLNDSQVTNAFKLKVIDTLTFYVNSLRKTEVLLDGSLSKDIKNDLSEYLKEKLVGYVKGKLIQKIKSKLDKRTIHEIDELDEYVSIELSKYIINELREGIGTELGGLSKYLKDELMRTVNNEVDEYLVSELNQLSELIKNEVNKDITDELDELGESIKAVIVKYLIKNSSGEQDLLEADGSEYFTDEELSDSENDLKEADEKRQELLKKAIKQEEREAQEALDDDAELTVTSVDDYDIDEMDNLLRGGGSKKEESEEQEEVKEISLPNRYKMYLENQLSKYITQSVFTKIDRGGSADSFNLSDAIKFSDRGFGKALNRSLGQDVEFNDGLNSGIHRLNGMILDKISEYLDNFSDVDYFSIAFKTVDFSELSNDATSKIKNTSAIVDLKEFRAEVSKIREKNEKSKTIFSKIDNSINDFNSLVLSESESMAILNNSDTALDDIRLIKRDGDKGVFIDSKDNYIVKTLSTLTDRDRGFLKAVSRYELFRVAEKREQRELQKKGVEWVSTIPKYQFYSPNKNISTIKMPAPLTSRDFFGEDKANIIGQTKTWLSKGYNSIGQSKVIDYVNFLKKKREHFVKDWDKEILGHAIALLEKKGNISKNLYTVATNGSVITYISRKSLGRFSLSGLGSSGLITIFDKDTKAFTEVVSTVVRDMNKYNKKGFIKLNSKSFYRLLSTYTEKFLGRSLENIEEDTETSTPITKLSALRFKRLTSLLSELEEIFIVNSTHILGGYLPLDIFITEHLAKIKTDENLDILSEGRQLSQTIAAVKNFENNESFYKNEYDNSLVDVKESINDIYPTTFSSEIDIDDFFIGEGSFKNNRNIKVFTKDIPRVINKGYNVGGSNKKYQTVLTNAIMEHFLDEGKLLDSKDLKGIRKSPEAWFNRAISNGASLDSIINVIEYYSIVDKNIGSMMKSIKGNAKIDKSKSEGEVLDGLVWIKDKNVMDSILNGDADMLIENFLNLFKTGLINGENHLYSPLYFALMYSNIFMSKESLESSMHDEEKNIYGANIENYELELKEVTENIENYFNKTDRNAKILSIVGNLLSKQKITKSATSGKLYTLRALLNEIDLLSMNDSIEIEMLRKTKDFDSLSLNYILPRKNLIKSVRKYIASEKNNVSESQKNKVRGLLSELSSLPEKHVNKKADKRKVSIFKELGEMFPLPKDDILGSMEHYLISNKIFKEKYRSTMLLLSEENAKLFESEVFRHISSENLEVARVLFSRFIVGEI